MEEAAAVGPPTRHGDRRAASATKLRAGTGPAVSGRIARLDGPTTSAAATAPTGRRAGARTVVVSGRIALLDGTALHAAIGRPGAARMATAGTGQLGEQTTPAVATARTGQAAPAPPPGRMARGRTAEPATPVGTRGPVTGIRRVAASSA